MVPLHAHMHSRTHVQTLTHKHTQTNSMLSPTGNNSWADSVCVWVSVCVFGWLNNTWWDKTWCVSVSVWVCVYVCLCMCVSMCSLSSIFSPSSPNLSDPPEPSIIPPHQSEIKVHKLFVLLSKVWPRFNNKPRVKKKDRGDKGRFFRKPQSHGVRRTRLHA